MTERAYTQEQLLRRLSLRQDTFQRHVQANVEADGARFDLRAYGQVQPDGSLLIQDPVALEAALKAEQQRMLSALLKSILATVFAESS